MNFSQQAPCMKVETRDTDLSSEETWEKRNKQFNTDEVPLMDDLVVLGRIAAEEIVSRNNSSKEA